MSPTDTPEAIPYKINGILGGIITPKLPESKDWYKVKSKQQKAEKKISTLANKLHNLLAEFYQKDKPDYELILILSEIGYSIRLHSASLIAIQALSKEKQKKSVGSL